jgi:predicted GIY-YIG superfamily endonuclease
MEAEFTPSFTYASRDLQTATVAMTRLILEAARPMFYVGITGDPEQRARGHRRIRVEGDFHEGVAREMYIIFETDSASEVRSAEKELIEFAKNFDGSRRRGEDSAASDLRYSMSNMVSWNARGGGGGPLTSEGPYYVYVLLGGG